MKRYFLMGTMVLLVWACSGVKDSLKTSAISDQKIQDSIKYDLLIDDIGFDQWYRFNFTPANDHTNDYYRSLNDLAVVTWNDYYNMGRYKLIIDSYIYYQPNIDYGIELNRKLFWYFKYIQDQYGIPLLLSSHDFI
jgi:hypothetical protein